MKFLSRLKQSSLLVTVLTLTGCSSLVTPETSEYLVSGKNFVITQKELNEVLDHEGRELKADGEKVLLDITLTKLMETRYSITDDEWKQVLEEQLIPSTTQSEETQKRSLKVRTLMSKGIESMYQPSDEQLKAFYQDWKPQRKVSYIETSDKDVAYKLRNDLETGKTILDIEESYKEKDSVVEFHQISYNEDTNIDQSLQKNLDQLKFVGDVELVEDTNLFILIRLEKTDDKTSLSEQSDDVLRDYLSYQNTTYNQIRLIQDLLKNENVKIHQENYDDLLNNYKLSDPKENASTSSSVIIEEEVN